MMTQILEALEILLQSLVHPSGQYFCVIHNM